MFEDSVLFGEVCFLRVWVRVGKGSRAELKRESDVSPQQDALVCFMVE